MSDIETQLSEIQGKVAAAAKSRGDVQLVAVSKTFPSADIRVAYDKGQRIFGESRLQEAETKIQELPPEIEWHFIGRVQRNKVRKILPLFPYIHAVDSMKLAGYMDGVAKDLGLKPKIFLQVNQAGEESKGGFSESELASNLGELSALQNVEIVGLMVIPPAEKSDEETRLWFRKLKDLRDSINAGNLLSLPFLSMGMSGDYEIAIEEGATHVRVGSAIFGKREKKIEGELG
ncbi:YggS family pyridoxal phosphate-dependent enzyme [Luteolibacter sp. AS25]|uniref:YggS family pyridoxal phosphate-dependent enzyme n=1 Tax=Luteolibacter sp. AS25 TaxID=3135776 RepID=UPI00398A818F